MKKILILTTVFFILITATEAQLLTNYQTPFRQDYDKQDENFRKKKNQWQFYGGFGLSISNRYFYIQFQPGLLYRMSKTVHLGGNLNFNYATRTDYGVRQNIFVYGTDLLAMYVPFRQMELSVDYQYSFVRIQQNSAWTKREVPALFLGAGYRTPHAVIGIRYDLLYQENRSLYPSAFMPYIRIYF